MFCLCSAVHYRACGWWQMRIEIETTAQRKIGWWWILLTHFIACRLSPAHIGQRREQTLDRSPVHRRTHKVYKITLTSRGKKGGHTSSTLRDQILLALTWQLNNQDLPCLSGSKDTVPYVPYSSWISTLFILAWHEISQLWQKTQHHTLSCSRLHGAILTKTCIDSFTGMPGKINISLMLALELRATLWAVSRSKQFGLSKYG